MREWLAFGFLSLIWGSSFLWISIGLRELRPLTVVSYRLLFGLAGISTVLVWQKISLPRDPKLIAKFAVLAFINTALPFVLITWGERQMAESGVASGMASILNGTVPLFTILIAHYSQHDERITLNRMLGIFLGFAGVMVLLYKDFKVQAGPNLWGELAVLFAAVSYGCASNYSRVHLRGQPPVLIVFMTLLLSALMILPLALAFEQPFHIPAIRMTWIAVTFLGLLGSCTALILFFYLIDRWGPPRVSTVSYLFPCVGLCLGILFNNEHAQWNLFAGAALIVGGVALVNHTATAALMQRGKTLLLGPLR